MGAPPIAHLRAYFVAFFTLCGLLLAAPAQAHQTAISTLHVEIRPDDREVDLLLGISPDDLADHLELDPNDDGYVDQAELPLIKPAVGTYLSEKLAVFNDGRECEAAQPGFVESPQRMPALLFRYTAECAGALGEVTLENRVMLEAPRGYTHYGLIQLGEDIHTTVFNGDTPTYTVDLVDSTETGEGGKVGEDGKAFAEPSLWDVLAQYTWQGVLHIVLGLDHVLFVILLLVAARQLRRLLWVVSTFTLAHSITLVASALELVSLSPSVVEPLIALSIAWLAVELLLDRKPGKHIFVLTFLFGLLHGFGFSYVLRDNVGLPTDALIPALFSFNLGVELGQIAIVCLAFPLVAWTRKQEWGRRAMVVVAALVLLVALYWFVTRLG
ncbi:MAG: HupE/UreJ family protein [Persicimonas sp.]